MKLPSIPLLVRALSTATMRFPLAMTATILAVSTLLVMIEKNGSEFLSKSWMMAQLGIPVFIALTTLQEVNRWKWIGIGGVVQAGILALLVFYGWSLPDLNAPDFGNVHIVRYGILLMVSHLFVSFAPFLNQNSISDFWEYNKQLFANFILGAAYAVILWAGLSLAVLAIDQLFQLNINGKIYLQLFILLIGIFNTSFFLYHFPVEYRYADLDQSYTLVLKTLCKFILIPIVALYFLILYAYSAKILFTWSLPIGWVASLVIGFSIAGILTYLLNYMLPIYNDNPVSRIYKRWFWWIMLPMIALLFVAVSRRIIDYGITEERFFVAYIGFWLLLSGCYFAISKTDNIKFVPISLAVFGLTAVLGPLSAFEVSVRSQKGILKQLLEQNGRMEAGKVVQRDNLLAEKDGKQMLSALEYLETHNQLYAIQDWLPMPLDSFKNAGIRPFEKIASWMHLNWEHEPQNTDSFVRVYAIPGSYRGTVEQYSMIFQLDLVSYQTEKPEGRTIQINTAKNGLILQDLIKGKQTVVDEYPLGYYLKEWFRKSENGSFDFPEGKSAIELKGKNTDLKLIINELEFNQANAVSEISRINGIALLREKRTK